MNHGHWLKVFMTIGSTLTLGVSVSANAGPFGLGGDSWKEEVLLHDGQKIIVERSQTYRGRGEPGQSAPIGEHTIRFALPGSNQPITWISEYGEDLGRTNFNLLALHVLDGTPYVVASPNLCLAYNKWGRPNPPYVFFKYEADKWNRIPLEAFPAEFKTVNVVRGIRGRPGEELVRMGMVSAQKVALLNSNPRVQPEYKTILREPLKGNSGITSCEEMIHYKCGWISSHGDFGREFMDSTCK